VESLHQGPLNINAYNILEGSVIVNGFDKPVLIRGRSHLNRAIHEDTVVIQILPKDQWKPPSQCLVEQEENEEEGNHDDRDDMG
jgi:exosome complex exonuclease DIS3/RRP44